MDPAEDECTRIWWWEVCLSDPSGTLTTRHVLIRLKVRPKTHCYFVRNRFSRFNLTRPRYFLVAHRSSIHAPLAYNCSAVASRHVYDSRLPNRIDVISRVQQCVKWTIVGGGGPPKPVNQPSDRNPFSLRLQFSKHRTTFVWNFTSYSFSRRQ